jgi:hypothetical protein
MFGVWSVIVETSISIIIRAELGQPVFLIGDDQNLLVHDSISVQLSRAANGIIIPTL